MLFDHSFLRDRQLVPVNKIRQGILVQDKMGVKPVALNLKVASVFPGTYPVVGDPVAVEVPDIVIGFLQLGGRQVGNLVDERQLVLYAKLVQFAHGMIAEGHLKETSGSSG